MEQLNNILKFALISVGKYEINVYTIVIVALTLIGTKIILWLIKKSLFSKYEAHKLDNGNAYAFYQIIKYIIWIISIAIVLESIGIKITLLLAGSAALLVGVGLGLQQTFNDIVSGLILLFERSIKINDILEIDGDIVKIQKIGIRTSEGLNRDEISIIIPNSLITTNKVINWSHQTKKTRFRIDVGVAYGSDIDLVLKLLEESALEHPDIYDKKLTEARFLDFGNSSLNFQVLFFSENIFRIEKIKSDIRKIIYKKFNEHNISIPFPQMDVYIKSNKTEKSDEKQETKS